MNPYESPQTVSKPRDVDWAKVDDICFLAALSMNLAVVAFNSFLLHANISGWSWYARELHWCGIPLPIAGGVLITISMYAKRRGLP